ncbi:hypothetical protein GCM10010145_57140 [Streptomyces ruber]|uniref:Terpene synthase n=2 Tax=Streptomyces TaxID=1883 RepID=A0A918EVW1_9ACTN|nr:hypothetical protein [Streptomyces ruber]GGQ80033.1 hypothetical protein GCM10010145_57140 [Streptomyces ruber]
MGLSPTEADFPPHWCPLESAVHPRVRQVEERAEAWIGDSGMCASEEERAWAVASRGTEFFARFAPDAADDERLLAGSLWVYFGFAFDDARCDAGPLSSRPAQFTALAGRIQRAFEAPGADMADERFAAPLQDIARRFRALGTPSQVRRFAHAQRAWLSGVSWQIGNQAVGRMPGLDEYLAMRLLASGGEPTFALLELATGQEVPEAEMQRPAVRALTELAVMVAALDNDRHSLHKEFSRDVADQNVYTVLTQHGALSLPEAVREATRLRDRMLLRFLRLYDRVRPRASAALGTYLQGLRYGMRGNIEWALRVPRYLGPDSGGEGGSPPRWAESPADSSPHAPEGLPSVAWWWDAALA